MTLPATFKYESPERVMGSSVDCSLQPLAGSSSVEDSIRRLRYLSPDHISATTSLESVPFKVNATTGNFNTTHLENGGSITMHEGRASYTTPDVVGPYNAAIAYLAGVSILNQVTEQTFASPASGALYHRNAGFSPRGGYNSRPAFSTYYTPAGTVTDASSINKLTSFLATNVWAGGGMVGEHGIEWRQGARGIGMPHNSVKTAGEGAKPISLKTSLGAWEQIEICTDDALISPQTHLMARSAVSGLLRLLEQDPRGRITGDLPIATIPLQAFHEASKDSTLKTKVPVLFGGELTQMSSLDIQRRYIEAMLTLSGSSPERRFPHFERIGLTAAMNVLDTLAQPGESRLHELAGVLEIAARHVRLTEKLGRGAILSKDNPQAWSVNTAYDFPLYSTSALKYWSKIQDEITKDILAKAKRASASNHPHGTVSDLRATAIREYGSGVTFVAPAAIKVGDKQVFAFQSPYQTAA